MIMYNNLSGCSALTKTKYLQRHNNAFEILFFEVLRSLDLDHYQSWTVVLTSHTQAAVWEWACDRLLGRPIIRWHNSSKS